MMIALLAMWNGCLLLRRELIHSGEGLTQALPHSLAPRGWFSGPCHCRQFSHCCHFSSKANPTCQPPRPYGER
ncbi:hypothetical protein ABFS83_05G072900 [Erythranthe nasuta]